MRKPNRILGALAVFWALGGCAAPATPPPRAPEPAAEPAAGAPPAIPPARVLAVPLAAVAPAAARCQPFVTEPVGCSAAGSPLELLSQALGVEDELARDRALAALQTCEAFEP